MDPALSLSGCAANFEAKLAAALLHYEVLHTAHPHVLHAMPEALGEVGQIEVHRPLVLHSAGHALGDLHRGSGAEVAIVGALLHGVDGAHAAILLQALAILGIKVLPWRLFCTSEEASAHCRPSAKAKRLHDMPRTGDAAISENGHAIGPRQFRNIVDRRGLGPAASTDLLRGADGADAHANTEGVGPAIEEVFRLQFRDDVACHDLQRREFLLHPRHHVALKHAVSLAAVDDDGIHIGSNESPYTITVLWSRAHRCCHHEALLLVLCRKRIVSTVHQVLACHQGDEALVLGQDRQFPFL
mmetsp:Transcript_39317/g.88395  ORF Transcript_39317/g.88395 Transcript_39317/m.88395 type:complete len:300 (-) Transcript_39317:767-1666(-)